MNIEETVKKINALIDRPDKDFKPHEVMQLSQAALNLAHAEAALNNIKRS
ncbi:MAG: hypothetical protein P1U80_07070 [Pseudomonadales bacterium]|nr:hypothetical protein [Pseudomonadales bacterium]